MELTAAAAWLNSAFAGIDAAVAGAVYGLHTMAGGFFTPFSQIMDLLGKGGALLIAVSLALILFPRTRRVGTVMLLALGVGALITNLGLKPTVARPRPYTFEGSIFYEMWTLAGQHTESDFSFPSGHTTAATAAMVGIFLSCPKRKSWVALVFALCMGLSRIYLGVHFFSDVLAGFAAGLVGAVVAYFIVKIIPEKYFTYEFRLMRRE